MVCGYRTSLASWCRGTCRRGGTVTSTIGRTAELAQAQGRLSTQPAGGVLFVGAAGIGTSTVLAATAELAGSLGFEVRRTRAAASKQDLPYVGLHNLIGDALGDASASLSAPPRRALDVVMLRADPPEGGLEVLAVDLAVLEVLETIARVRRLALVLDDVRWLARPTRRGARLRAAPRASRTCDRPGCGAPGESRDRGADPGSRRAHGDRAAYAHAHRRPGAGAHRRVTVAAASGGPLPAVWWQPVPRLGAGPFELLRVSGPGAVPGPRAAPAGHRVAVVRPPLGRAMGSARRGTFVASDHGTPDQRCRPGRAWPVPSRRVSCTFRARRSSSTNHSLRRPPGNMRGRGRARDAPDARLRI